VPLGSPSILLEQELDLAKVGTMMQPPLANAAGPFRFRRFCRLLVSWFGFLSACQMPAAHISDTGPGTPLQELTVVLVRQTVADHVMELTYHPARFGRDLLVEPMQCLWAFIAGEFGKRVQLAFLGKPEPLSPDRINLDPVKLEAELHDVVG